MLILTPILSSNADFNVLRKTSTDCTARSTTPFDPFDRFGACSASVFAPVLEVLTSSIKYRIAGSWSLFNKIGRSLSPHSAMSSRTILAAYLPVEPFDGTTTAFFIFVSFSITTRIVNFSPSSSPGKQ